MPSIDDYANAAVRKEPSVARHKDGYYIADQAVIGQGIRNEHDRKRLVPQILQKLRARGINPDKRPWKAP